METEFYVGYFESAPEGIAGFIKSVVATLLVIIVVIAWLIGGQQRGFNASTYEYNQEVEISGLLISEPVPAIQVYLGTTVDQIPLTQTVPIVAFGKIGGYELIRANRGSWVTVKGHLIYFHGKTLIEIPNQENIKLSGDIPSIFPKQAAAVFGAAVSYTGEIVDAKCFFGVMKPGHGKPHRSCAIRCISGGIPAVFKALDQNGNYSYHLIIMEPDRPVNIANYIGETVEIKGTEGKFNDWDILRIGGSSAITPTISSIESDLSSALTMCW